MSGHLTVSAHRPVGCAGGDPALIRIGSSITMSRAGAHFPGMGFTEWFLPATLGLW